jgi:3-hydroxybutyryl-CoA dehydrogenase
MGGGIAQVAAARGLEVTLIDISEEVAQKGKAKIVAALGKLVEKGKLSAQERDAQASRITPRGDYEALAQCDFAIEAATENQDLKKKIFAEMDRRLTPGAVLATNTSSISITLLAAATRRPEQVIGMHFMNPVPLMQLCEIIRGLQTSDATYRATMALGQALGKELVTARDVPGFIVNRLLIPYLNEACFALAEGLGTIEDIDKAIKLGLNHPMGPFTLADLIGLDTCLAIAEVLHRELGEDKYRPAPLLRNYVAAGWLGRKSGRGFYKY